MGRTTDGATFLARSRRQSSLVVAPRRNGRSLHAAFNPDFTVQLFVTRRGYIEFSPRTAQLEDNRQHGTCCFGKRFYSNPQVAQIAKQFLPTWSLGNPHTWKAN